MRDSRRPLVCCEKKAADWPRMCRNSTIAQVANDALPDVGHQVAGDVGAKTLDQVEGKNEPMVWARRSCLGSAASRIGATIRTSP